MPITQEHTPGHAQIPFPRPVPETLVRGGYDEKEMEAAIARTEAEVFITALEKSDGSDFAVKAPSPTPARRSISG